MKITEEQRVAPLDASTVTHLQSWQGRSESLTDTVTAAPVAALSATLDRDDPAPVTGTQLPPLWHWLYMLPRHRQSELGPDGHRIHYDRRYVTETEGYPGLIVHGPLIATLLVDLVRRCAPHAQVLSFEFRAVRPTFDLHPFFLNGEPSADGKTVRLWANDHEGYLTMQAAATLDDAPLPFPIQ